MRAEWLPLRVVYRVSLYRTNGPGSRSLVPDLVSQGMRCLQPHAGLHVTASFCSVTGLPLAFLPLRKDRPLRVEFPPWLQGRTTSACLWRQKALGLGVGGWTVG